MNSPSNYNELVPRHKRIPFHNKFIRLVGHTHLSAEGLPQTVALRDKPKPTSPKLDISANVSPIDGKTDIIQFNSEFRPLTDNTAGA